ncbi:hypothetical protein TELCIR_10114 [Teladorsagia circumcincta]|uniref:Unspecific monooxygenase n=1 Tax=Teladorsagia circumcincta TaxID=45464 RepID=A0A2G9UD69_TELCI|nr:hypothetical protein TELCIR_10114 [Teladorsagia circumcincta]
MAHSPVFKSPEKFQPERFLMSDGATPNKLDFFKIHEEFAKLTKEYGSIFTIYMPKPHVVITDFEGVKEALVKKGDDFIGRSGIFPDTVFQNVENGGVIFSQGENWREQRRASLHILRDFGMGKNLMEEQLRRTIKEDVDRALKSYSVDQEPECLVQAYYQKMQSNPHLK